MALLASSISCTMSSGRVATDAWLVGKVIVFLALIRSAIHFSVSTGINRGCFQIPPGYKESHVDLRDMWILGVGQ